MKTSSSLTLRVFLGAILAAAGCSSPGGSSTDIASRPGTDALDARAPSDTELDLPVAHDSATKETASDIGHEMSHDGPPPADAPSDSGSDTGVDAPDAFCVCPPSLPVCVLDKSGGRLCTAACPNTEMVAGTDSCEGILGLGACCQELFDVNGVRGNYCQPAGACCTACGEQCCSDGETCEGVGDDVGCVPPGGEWCGGGFYCNPGLTCTEAGCCSLSAPTACGGTCCPLGWECSGQAQCVPPGGQYCNADLSCAPGTHCEELAGGWSCTPDGYIQCEGGQWCGPGQVCSPKGCCPADLPVPCGTQCCDESEQCDTILWKCQPLNSTPCGDKGYCSFGSLCSPDGLVCVPDSAPYCGDGKWCDPGEICVGTSCCPQGLPQKCGPYCCFSQDKCINDGEACIPAGADYCGNGIWCPPGQLCGNGGSVCYPVGGELCPDGHWCDPGLQCAGTTCCEYAAPPSCGSLCCPSTWSCVNGGEACIPPGAQYCGDGAWCNAGSICKPSGGCMQTGSTECGDGLVCPPGHQCVPVQGGMMCCPTGLTTACGSLCCPDNFKCIQDGLQFHCIPLWSEYCGEGLACFSGMECGPAGQCMPLGSTICDDQVSFCPPFYACRESGGCCPMGKPVTCGSTCCPSVFSCLLDGQWELCLPPGASYCGEGLWCPLGSKCPNYVDQCVPPGSQECPWGQLCGSGYVCSSGGKKCCPQSQPVACGNVCCGSGDTCIPQLGGGTCYPAGYKLCPGALHACPNGEKCSDDGLDCIPYGWDYCGAGKKCGIGKVCTPIGTCCEVASQYCPGIGCCPPGTKCGTAQSGCIPNDSQVCPNGTVCNAGMQCAPLGGCVPAADVPCEPEFSCTPPSVCGADGVSCAPPNFLCDDPVCTNDGFPLRGIDLCFPAVQGAVARMQPAGGALPADILTSKIESWENVGTEFISSRITAGVYDALLDAPYDSSQRMNWITCGKAGDKILVLESAWFADNGEGPYPDGPYSQLFLDIYRIDDSGEEGLVSGDQFFVEDWERPVGNDRKALRGPRTGACAVENIYPGGYKECVSRKPQDGWQDGDLLHYRQAGLYKWGSGNWSGASQEEKEQILLLVFEDSGGDELDLLGLETIRQKYTMPQSAPCGVWVPLRRFSDPTEEVPGQPTGEISGFVRLKTVTVGLAGQDPWNCGSSVPVQTRVRVSVKGPAVGSAIGFDLLFPWMASARLQVPIQSDGQLLGSAANLGDGLSQDEGVALTAFRSVSPPGVHTELSAVGTAWETFVFWGGETLVEFWFRIINGKPTPGMFSLENATLASALGTLDFDLNLSTLNKCHKCAGGAPNADSGFRCPKSSAVPTNCPN